MELADDGLTARYLGNEDDAEEDDTVATALSEHPLLPVPFGDVPSVRIIQPDSYNSRSIFSFSVPSLRILR